MVNIQGVKYPAEFRVDNQLLLTKSSMEATHWVRISKLGQGFIQALNDAH